MNNKTEKVTIGGREFIVDVEKAVKDGYLKPLCPRKVGQKYDYKGETYLVATLPGSNNEVYLVDVNDGCPFNDKSVTCEDFNNISVSQWRDLTGGREFFKLINE